MRVDARGIALVVVAVSTLQVGAAFAVTLFDEVGRAGAALLRLGIAALVLLAVWRPSLAGHSRADVADRGRLRARARDDELGDLLRDGPDPDRRRGHDRVRRAARPGRRALAQAARPRLGRARRRRDPAADEPVRRLRPRRRRGRARAARGRRVGGLHPAVRAHGDAVPGRARAGDRDARRRAARRARRDRAGRRGAAGARAARPGRDRRARLLRDPVLARARVAAPDPGARVRRADVARAGRRRARRVRRPRPGARRAATWWRSGWWSSRARERRSWGRKITDAT